uniref:Uncharacterized protein n=1 Tax=Cannabis sativa TaxID=3483 RepID=A0A803QMT9_CANSA
MGWDSEEYPILCAWVRTHTLDHHTLQPPPLQAELDWLMINYDASSLLAMNVSATAGGIGQLSPFQQPRAAAGDDRRTIDPS